MMGACGYDQRPLDGDAYARGSGGRGGGASGGSSGPDGQSGGQGGEAGGLPIQQESFPNFGELGEPDQWGVRVPEGYSVRRIAESGQPVRGGRGYVWHDLPDGGATYPLKDGGYVYVSNCELSFGGGVGAIAFTREGHVRGAYPICTGTRRNCQGGATPRGTFLTCEEVPDGLVYECDPLGFEPPLARPELGVFQHEAVAYDEIHHVLYLSEDEWNGGLYRFVPSRVPHGLSADLSEGRLEVAAVAADGSVRWFEVPDPRCIKGTPTRFQVPETTAFNGGEGIWWRPGKVYLTTKGDDRVWEYDIRARRISVLYDGRTALNPVLTGVDAIIGTTSGELLVAEDPGNMQVVVILPNGRLKPLLQVEGQSNSEITGIAFAPGRINRFYFSSQRGNGRGLTYEMTGPFFR